MLVGLSNAERCDLSRGTVEATGAVLPSNFEFRCPSSAYPHWGVTSGPPNAPPYFISINLARIGSDDAKLRYVICHETAHARASVGQESFDWRDEDAADQYAADHGFPNRYFARTDEGQRSPILFVAVAMALVIAVAALVVSLRRRRRRKRRR